MADSKHSKAAPAASVNDSSKIVLSSDPAIEVLLAEIVDVAHGAEQHMRLTPFDTPEIHEYHASMLRGVVARLGWMADIALQRLGSIHTMCNGSAEQWLLTSASVEALLEKEGQS